MFERQPSRVVEMPVDASVLNFFTGDKRKALVQYLASSGIWCVAPAENESNSVFLEAPGSKNSWNQGFCSRLELTPSFFGQDNATYLKNAVSELDNPHGMFKTIIPYGGGGGITSGDDHCTLNVALHIKSEKDKAATQPDNTQEKTATIKINDTDQKNTKGAQWSHSTLYIQGTELALEVRESSYMHDRTLTKRAATFVLDELRKIATAIKATPEMNRDLLAKGAAKQLSHDEIRSYGTVILGYVNPGKEGYLKLFITPNDSAKSHAFNWGTTGEQTNSLIAGWSDNKDERFFFAIRWTLPGDGDASIEDFGQELRFCPADGSAETVLYTHPAGPGK